MYRLSSLQPFYQITDNFLLYYPVKDAKTNQANSKKGEAVIKEVLLYPAAEKKYTLPIGNTHKLKNIDYNFLQSIWNSFPPWFDRIQTLLILLTNAYETHYGTKPVVTICTGGPGMGKSRTLVEWGVQIFQHPCVVEAFLNRQELSGANITHTDISQQIATAWHQGDTMTKERAMFLIQFHRALREHTVITVTAQDFLDALNNKKNKQEVITSAQVEIVCKNVMAKALRERFGGEGTPTIPFDDADPDLSRTSVQDMIDLYLKMVVATVPNYFSNDSVVRDDTIFTHLPSLRTLIINIDDFQDLLPIKSERQSGKNMAYEIARSFVYTHKNRIVNMAGLETGPVSELSDPDPHAFILRSLPPLEPILTPDFLSAACKSICGRSLYYHSDPKSLPKKLSDQLQQVWIAANGVPRTMELMVKKLSERDYSSLLRTIEHHSKAKFSIEQVTELYKAMQIDKI